MEDNLVIVESPAKAKTIEKFLGKDYLVKSSFGHIRDLAKKNLGIDLTNSYKPEYIVSPDKKKVVDELKKLAKNAKTVWLASDEDREGEAISWHLYEELGLKPEKTHRIVFHEITKDAILNAIKNPRSIDVNLVNAQQARRVLDRLVGFELSPLLWKKIKPSLSAGRVQSVAVKLIVEREREINAFKVTSAFKVAALFNITDPKLKSSELQAELEKRITEVADAKGLLEKLIGAQFKVADVVKKPGKKSPSPPFTTSTLQQEASRKLGYSVAQTMTIAQKLYEAGKITYMRTDSVNLSQTAISGSSAVITALYGKDYVHTRNFVTKSKGAQEAHEAIRPTFMENSSVDGNATEKRLYELIWKRTLASQMSDAILEKN
jgi:DNA topoisomerase-1